METKITYEEARERVAEFTGEPVETYGAALADLKGPQAGCWEVWELDEARRSDHFMWLVLPDGQVSKATVPEDELLGRLASSTEQLMEPA